MVDCRCKANCPLVGPGPIGGVLSVGPKERNELHYFWEKGKFFLDFIPFKYRAFSDIFLIKRKYVFSSKFHFMQD